MTYSFIGLGKPIAAVNNIIKNQLKAYRRSHPDDTPPLTPGGIFASDLTNASAFAGENGMCAYISMEDLLSKSDLIFVFLSDKALKNISLTLGKHGAKGKIFCHFSPAFSSTVLDYNSNNTYLSAYLPYFSKDDSGRTITGPIIAEGYGRLLDKLSEVFHALSVDVSFVSSEERLMCITASTLAKDMPLILKYTAGRLFKYALASHKDLSNELMNLAIEDPSVLSSYNPTTVPDADFAYRQCENLKSLALDDITNLYASLLCISSRIESPGVENDKIAAIAKKILEQK